MCYHMVLYWRAHRDRSKMSDMDFVDIWWTFSHQIVIDKKTSRKQRKRYDLHWYISVCVCWRYMTPPVIPFSVSAGVGMTSNYTFWCVGGGVWPLVIPFSVCRWEGYDLQLYLSVCVGEGYDPQWYHLVCVGGRGYNLHLVLPFSVCRWEGYDLQLYISVCGREGVWPPVIPPCLFGLEGYDLQWYL